MIKDIDIHNFQSHKHSKLVLDPGVNIIVGSTDSGKSSIIRALRWLIWNRPSGDGFRSDWGGETSVKVQIGDSTIARSKDVDGVYLLNDQVFKAFGTNVPVEITNALHLNEINLQQQLDSPFLLTISPGEVAKHFNKIAHLDQIDHGMSNVQKSIREIEQNIKHYKGTISELEEEEKEYKYLDTFETELEVLEQSENILTNKNSQRRMLSELIVSLQQLSTEIEKYSELLKAEKDVTEILLLIKNKKTLISDSEELENLISDVEMMEEKISEHLPILKLEDAVKAALIVYAKRKEIEGKKLRLESDINAIHKNSNKLKDATELMNALIKTFHKEMPDICPLCGQKVKK